jgi:DNA ligase (NAD+)
LGFKVAYYLKGYISDDLPLKRITDIHADMEFIRGRKDDRYGIPYDIDGIVFKVNDIHLQQELGQTAKYPKHSIARKFKSKSQTTTLREVTWQVGRTGKFTPVGRFDPVDINGVTISKATLHNIDEIRRLDLYINDTIEVIRSGDVIPKIVGRVAPGGIPQDINYPAHCYSCNNPTTEPHHKLCKAVLIERTKHFVSREAMNISGVGEALITEMAERGVITQYPWEILQNPLVWMSDKGFSESCVQRLVKSLEKAKNTELWRFIYALGIEGVGKEAAKELAKLCIAYSDKPVLNLEVFGVDSLKKLPKIGEKTAENIHDFFHGDREKLDYLTSIVSKLTFK